MKLFSLIPLSLFIITACSHSPINTKLSSEWTPLSLSKQKKLIRSARKSHKEYNGLYLAYDAEIVFLNSKIQNNNLKIQGQFKNWTSEKADSQKNTRAKHLSSNAEFFLSFYTPQIKRNKLNQAAADWKAVLKVNTSEYEGVIKLRENRTHHNKVYYPDLNLWSTSYLITFPVSTASLDMGNFEVLILGPEGMAKFKY